MKTAGVLRAGITNRLNIVSFNNNQLTAIHSSIDDEIREELKRIVLVEAPPEKSQLSKPVYSSEILKLLIYHWILNSDHSSKWLDQYSQSINYPEEMTSKTLTYAWLAKEMGCTYRPVSNTLNEIGTAVIRHSDQSVRLKYFPRYAWEKLLVLSDKSRMTMRFADSSGQPRSPESLLKRLRSLKRQDIGVGGVSGARRIFPDIDLIGTPRLDLTLHCPGEQADISFIRQLDPALIIQESKSTSASLVIHFLRRKNSYFKIEKDRSVWADPVECLLDLQEARLETQALEFRNAIAPGEYLR
ncbi:hypothetical protein KA005_45655 [bacterium]|nr:hypothetical protein [bacterium]